MPPIAAISLEGERSNTRIVGRAQVIEEALVTRDKDQDTTLPSCSIEMGTKSVGSAMVAVGWPGDGIRS
jgi:hypothetical protein